MTDKDVAEIPPHMLDGLTSAAQQKVFGKTPKAAAKTVEKAAEKAQEKEKHPKK